MNNIKYIFTNQNCEMSASIALHFNCRNVCYKNYPLQHKPTVHVQSLGRLYDDNRLHNIP